MIAPKTLNHAARVYEKYKPNIIIKNKSPKINNCNGDCFFIRNSMTGKGTTKATAAP
jgi:hypothetical protein